MFCLRSWIPILFFLSVSNASPIYLILFVTATYLLNRPCVYCSLLLAILVIALFDFHTSWFTPSYLHAEPFTSNPNTSLAENATALASAVAGTLNNTVDALVRNVTEAVKGRINSEEVASANATKGGSATWIGEWVRTMVSKEWRVPCLDVVVRL